MSASADSDIPARIASALKRAFSTAEGRAVMDGNDALAVRSIMAEMWQSAANADTPLSCNERLNFKL
jgi:hypothetical protein